VAKSGKVAKSSGRSASPPAKMSHNGSSETSSFLDENWTAWFCGLSGNHFFCEVEKSYIEDTFNLFGLKHFLPKDYSKALDTILDRLTPMEPESEELSRSAALLYGLIHARYIITSHGLDAMHRKFMNREFGECPRALCRGQPVVPVSLLRLFALFFVSVSLCLSLSHTFALTLSVSVVRVPDGFY